MNRSACGRDARASAAAGSCAGWRAINSRLTDIAAAAAELQFAAPVLGLDPEQIRDWAADAEQIPLSTTNPVDNRVFRGARLGYLTVEVEARRSEDRDTVTLYWFSYWDTSVPEASISPPGTRIILPPRYLGLCRTASPSSAPYDGLRRPGASKPGPPEEDRASSWSGSTCAVSSRRGVSRSVRARAGASRRRGQCASGARSRGARHRPAGARRRTRRAGRRRYP